jgi:hypothetical protein
MERGQYPAALFQTDHYQILLLRLALSLGRMSALGQKQTLDWRPLMSAIPPKADIDGRSPDVRFVPEADILHCGKRRRYSITSSAIARTSAGIVR